MNNFIHDIKVTLEAVGAGDMFITSRRTMMVDTSKFDCDYYQFLEGNVAVINSYAGKYMSSYSWAELTIAYLDGRKKIG